MNCNSSRGHGRSVTVRPGSSDGRPTLEIRGSNGRGLEIRYGE